jgi:N-acetylmuramoyl-L-alanine amidase
MSKVLLKMLRKTFPNRSLLSCTAAMLTFFLLAGCANSSRVTAVSENFNSRVSIIVIHHTTANFEDSLRILTKRSGRPVSSHYLVPEPNDPSYTEKKLRIYQLVPETGRAWHAGNSYWGGRISLNDQSIGIEIVNQTYCEAGSELAVDVVDEDMDAEDLSRICFYPDFPESQMALVIELLEDILERYPDISPTNIVGHSDIAPDRKIDPGPRFPWQRLYRLGFGAWFDDDTVVRYWEQFRRAPMPLSNVQRALAAYGYDVEPTGVLDEHTQNVLRAFQMHFRPSRVTGTPSLETAAILYALIEKYRPDELEDLLQVVPAPLATDIDDAIAVDDDI